MSRLNSLGTVDAAPMSKGSFLKGAQIDFKEMLDRAQGSWHYPLESLVITPSKNNCDINDLLLESNYGR